MGWLSAFLERASFYLGSITQNRCSLSLQLHKTFTFFPCCFTGASSNHQEKQMCFSKKQIRCDWSNFTDSLILSFGSLDHFTSLYTFDVVSWVASLSRPKLYDRYRYSLILSEMFEILTNRLSHLFDPQHDVLLVLVSWQISGWPERGEKINSSKLYIYIYIYIERERERERWYIVNYMICQIVTLRGFEKSPFVHTVWAIVIVMRALMLIMGSEIACFTLF